MEPDEQGRKPAERKDDVIVKGPFGLEIRANGKEVKGLLLGVIGLVAVLVVVRDHDANATEKLALNDARAAARAQAIGLKLETLVERFEEIGYILTLNDEERRALKYTMPDSLRRRTRPSREDYR